MPDNTTNFRVFIIAGYCLIALVACRKPQTINDRMENYDERLSGGQQTTFNETFDDVFPVLSASKVATHDLGDAVFGSTFVTAPAPINPGLGPVFNNVSCGSCHVNNGVGKPPVNGNDQVQSFLFKLSMPGYDAHGGSVHVPNYGVQLQTRAVFGVQPEGTVSIAYSTIQGEFSDGEKYSLQKPTYTIANPYAPLPAGVLISPRLPMAVIGLGLLDALTDDWMLEHQDVNDANNDGISGKVNYVWNERTQTKTIGRFGWKATIPTIEQQVALAFNEDMGITSPLFPVESTYGQFQYDKLNDDSEINDSILSTVTFYMKSLAVTARRNVNDATVQQGKSVFKQLNCSGCHLMTARTGVNMGYAEVSNQLIFPFTDLLLHDMGNDLSDNRPEFDALGSEWRTPPLWGIGLSQKINGNTHYLHDGRARSLEEAILWHSGEAEFAKNNFKALSKTDRNALVKFLQSL
jgi:CxxC motif-containing protein (DUF1111 family)